MKPPRIALIHALRDSIAPINDALARDWPAAQRMNLLDDSLSADLARSAALDAAMHLRFQTLADYALGTGANAILYTCSAFGPAIEAVAARHPAIPVLKPNEAMIAEALAALGAGVAGDVADGGGGIGLVASFAPTLQTMPAEFPPGTTLHTALAEGALAALQAGDGARHDRLAAEAARQLARRGCRLIALSQFSLARARDAVAAATGLPVLTTVDSAVALLRSRLG